MVSMEGTDESWISDGTAILSIRTDISQFPLLKFIFRLLIQKILLDLTWDPQNLIQNRLG